MSLKKKKLWSIGIIAIKVKKQGWSPTYTCRYSSGHLISYSSSRDDWIRDLMPTRLSADVGNHPYFFTFSNIDSEINNFSLYLFVCFIITTIILGQLAHISLQKKEWNLIIITFIVLTRIVESLLASTFHIKPFSAHYTAL